MSKDRKYMLILGALVLALVLVEYFKPRPLDWTPTLSAQDKIPFGALVLDSVLTNLFPGAAVLNSNNTLYEMSEEEEELPENIFILASNFTPDSLDMEVLFKTVESGGNAFIAASFYGSKFADTLNLQAGFNLGQIIRDEPQINPESDSASIHFVNPHLHTGAYYYRIENVSDFFTSFDTTRTTVLAVNEKNRPVYLKTNWGEGAFYLSSVPLAYTNYYLLKENNSEYAAQSLSYLPVADIAWTEYYQTGRMESPSPLRFVLSNPSLKWGFYVTMGGLLVFMLFEVKRKQRAIPVIEPPKNTTLEFVKTVGNLFYRTKSHKNIAHKKITYFLDYLRTKYRLDTSNMDEEFREKLEKKSGKSREEVDALCNMIKSLEQKESISKKELLALNRKIDVFYQNMKNQ